MKKNTYFLLENFDKSFKINLLNIWDKNTLPHIIKELESLQISKDFTLSLDFKNLVSIDSSAIIYLLSFLENFEEKSMKFENFEIYKKDFEFYKKHYQNSSFKEEKTFNFFENLGKKVYELFTSSSSFLIFLGQVFYFFVYSLKNPKKIRFKAILKYIESSAVNALLIVAVSSFLVGVVIAYQGAVQLEKFGANIFIVEMIAITMFREIAPLLTAIIIAGRSASSYTAEIGAMKITEEIDAMRTMNFEPIMFLTIPRIFALCFSLPLLVFFADIIGIMGGMLIAFTSLDVSFVEFITRLHNEVALKHFIIGVFKAVFFGFAISLIGSYRGFQVQNNTTSIGKYTTLSVVNAIFVVILIDALFSIIFTELGL